AFRNDGVPPKSDGPPETWAPIGTQVNDRAPDQGLTLKFTPWSEGASASLLGEDSMHTAVAILDVDEDRDLDLVITADGEKKARVILNDRLGRFREGAPSGLDGFKDV